MVRRDRAQPGAVLTRVRPAMLRVGTFEFFAAPPGARNRFKRLADYVIARHYPALAASAQPYLDLLAAVSRAGQAESGRTLARRRLHPWRHEHRQLTLSAGETIDYGPLRLMETYSPGTVFSSIDSAGRSRLRQARPASPAGTWRAGRNPAAAHRTPTQSAPCRRPRRSSDAPARAPVRALAARFGPSSAGRNRRCRTDRALIDDFLPSSAKPSPISPSPSAHPVRRQAAGNGPRAQRPAWPKPLTRVIANPLASPQPTRPAETTDCDAAHQPVLIPRNHGGRRPPSCRR